MPQNWSQIELGDVLEQRKTKIDPEELEDPVPYLGLKHIQKEEGNIIGKGTSDDVKSAKTRFSSGDLLYGKLRPYLNKVAIPDFEGVCSTDILVFKGDVEGINNRFLKYRMLSSGFVEYADKNTTGVQHPRVSYDTISDFDIGLPPLPEQRRIVEKIEELVSRLDAGVKSLETAQKQLERYRQSLLKTAVEGRLTQEWREEYEGELESASELLEWAENHPEINKYKSGNRLNEIEEDILFDIPDCWTWAQIGDVAKQIQYGYTASAEDNEVGPKFLRISDIQNNSVDWEEAPYCEIEDNEKKKYLLNSGDIVFARTGGTVGKNFLLQGKFPESVFASYLIRLVLLDRIHEEYVYQFFQSLFYWRQITEGKIGVGQPNVNATKLASLAIPVPPSQEQNKIVELLDGKLSVVDNSQSVISSELKRASRLRQAILKKAFEGRLVPQEPGDGSAGELLVGLEEKGRGEEQAGLDQFSG